MSDEMKALNIDDTIYETIVPESNGRKWSPPNERLLDAFIPGTILAVKVEEGQSVKKGDVLLILDAMKMYNEIVAPMPAKIKKIAVEAGNQVVKNQLLVELE